jgi:lipid-A-disaccharide synthase-like uncharacterized protein
MMIDVHDHVAFVSISILASIVKKCSMLVLFPFIDILQMVYTILRNLSIQSFTNMCGVFCIIVFLRLFLRKSKHHVLRRSMANGLLYFLLRRDILGGSD